MQDLTTNKPNSQTTDQGQVSVNPPVKRGKYNKSGKVASRMAFAKLAKKGPQVTKPTQTVKVQK